MQEIGLTILLVIAAYLIGSCSSAILICKFMGLPDPRRHGSQNPGATNVLRTGGRKAAFLTLVGDVLKGLLPVWLAKSALGVDLFTQGTVALAAFLGHLYPIFFKFKGGKGVATAIGVIFPLSWFLGVLLVVTWILVLLLFRFSSLAALVASILTPFYTLWVAPEFVEYISVMAFFLIWRHRKNVLRLWKGTEEKIRF